MKMRLGLIPKKSLMAHWERLDILNKKIERALRVGKHADQLAGNRCKLFKLWH